MKTYLKKKKKGSSYISDFITIALIIAIIIYLYEHNIYYSIISFAVITAVVVLVGKTIVITNQKRLRHSPIGKIDAMTGEMFEEYILTYLTEQGYKGYLTRTTADYGADIVIEKNGTRTVVQVKRWRGKVGINAVQQVIGSIKHYSAYKGMVVTNSCFTENANRLANSNGVILWDRTYLTQNVLRSMREKNLTQ